MQTSEVKNSQNGLNIFKFGNNKLICNGKFILS